MKRIAVIAHGLSGGGAERVAAMLANYFAERQYTVLFVAAYSSEREYELDRRIEYIYIDCASPNHVIRMISRSFKIKNVVTKFKADMAFSFITNELIPLEFTRIPVIPSLRIDPKSTDASFVRRNIRKFVYHHSKNIVFQTKDARDYFDAAIRKKGIIIGNPIQDNLPVWNKNGHRKVFITACRISKQKNIPMLVNAFIAFHCKHPDYTLEIYGDGDPKQYKDQMVQYVNNLAADKFITFMGHSTSIHTIMSNSAAFVLSSDFEGLSNSMLEAMAIGIPSICTDCPPGGAKEYMKGGEAGILVNVGDTKALTKAMCDIVEDSELSYRISENGKYVREYLMKDVVCAQWEKLI